MDFLTVSKFEKLIADYFGAYYGVATDSCTHAIELSLRYDQVTNTLCPRHTYLSVPMTLMKLELQWDWSLENNNWSSYYYLDNTRIIDAAVMWKKKSYIPGTLMCLSFQFKKHLSIGRGGMILTDDYNSYNSLKEMSYDGRVIDKPWAEQEINRIGYHYYMTPESADYGIRRFNEVKDVKPRDWSYQDYPNLSKLKVFQ